MEHETRKSIEFYEVEADKYDQQRFLTPAGKHLDEIQREIVLSLAEDFKGKRVLDIACGTGRFALEFARNGASVTALDSSEGMLDIVKDKLEQEGLQASTVRSSATELPFKDGEFDICVCINALNHMPEHGKILGEISRVLAEGGILVSNYTNYLSIFMPAGLLVNLRKKSLTRDVYTKWFSPFEMIKLNASSNLSVEQMVGFVHKYPFKSDSSLVMKIFDSFNRAFRTSPLRWIAPVIFAKSRKISA
ncbi:MAG: methyltransferase domain-containing protein [Deltaproteobacteria bacterium]|nr:methyltransferase domain-containing protein [Deltaproteobacteria bacterium]